MFKFGKYVKEFGFGFTAKYVKNHAMYKLTKKQKYLDKNYANIKKYLDVHYGSVMSGENIPDAKIPKDFKVWLFWWQGYNQDIPVIVKKCIESVKSNFPNNEVIIIDKNNYTNYVEIPKYILDKVESKVISITHFSDIMRATLLSNLGGVWIDATVYLTKPIYTELQQYKFYSNKLPKSAENDKYVSDAKWSAFFLASNAGNSIVVNLRNILFEYWKKHNFLINYYLIDYCIALSYDKFESVKEMIDSVPINNANIHKLSQQLFNKYNQELFNELTNNTSMFKLTYRFDKEKTTIEDTFYKKIVGEN